MTQEEITKDREARKNKASSAIEAILKETEFTLVAEDMWTPSTKMTVEIKLVDFKQYEIDKPVEAIATK